MPWGEASTIFYGHPINAFDEPAPMFATMVKIPKSILIISKYYKYITHGGVLFSKMPPWTLLSIMWPANTLEISAWCFVYLWQKPIKNLLVSYKVLWFLQNPGHISKLVIYLLFLKLWLYIRTELFFVFENSQSRVINLALTQFWLLHDFRIP